MIDFIFAAHSGDVSNRVKTPPARNFWLRKTIEVILPEILSGDYIFAIRSWSPGYSKMNEWLVYSEDIHEWVLPVTQETEHDFRLLHQHVTRNFLKQVVKDTNA